MLTHAIRVLEDSRSRLAGEPVITTCLLINRAKTAFYRIPPGRTHRAVLDSNVYLHYA